MSDARPDADGSDKQLEEETMTATRPMKWTVAALAVGAAFALNTAQAQQPKVN